jgi:hypothetical protein
MERYRAYFNRKREAPQVWSIDEGEQTSEINVQGFRLLPGCTARSVFNNTKPNEDSPSAWIEIHADGYYIRDGEVYFTRHPAAGRP